MYNTQQGVGRPTPMWGSNFCKRVALVKIYNKKTKGSPYVLVGRMPAKKGITRTLKKEKVDHWKNQFSNKKYFLPTLTLVLT